MWDVFQVSTDLVPLSEAVLSSSTGRPGTTTVVHCFFKLTLSQQLADLEGFLHFFFFFGRTEKGSFLGKLQEHHKSCDLSFPYE